MRDLRKDLDICYKATPGPWKRNEKPSFGDWWVYVGGQHICLLPADKKGTHFGEMFKANAEFIAAAREGWPEAIERAIKAEEEVVRLQAERDICGKWPVRIGEYFCGAEIVGADYKRKTITIEWRGLEVTP